jgi:glycosyltransferase involved in cell wall biosynthesis
MANRASSDQVSLSMPLVSVVIPLLNAGSYIDECLSSVIHQTYRNLEVIVVDDGSSDDGPERVRKVQQSSQVTVRYVPSVDRQSCGPGWARQRGVQEAQGSLLAFLDADDVWVEDKIAAQVAVFEKFPTVGLVYGKISFVDRASQPMMVDGYGTMGKGIPDQPFMAFGMILRDNVVPTSTVMVRTSWLHSVGGFHTEPRHHHEDWLVWCKLAYFYNVFFLPSVLAYHRVHTSSYGVTLLQQRNLIHAEINFLQLLFTFLLSHPKTDKSKIRQHFTRQLWRSLLRVRSWGASGEQLWKISDALENKFPQYHELIRLQIRLVSSLPLGLARDLRRLRRKFKGM